MVYLIIFGRKCVLLVYILLMVLLILIVIYDITFWIFNNHLSEPLIQDLVAYTECY
jgi:hypothetical protein